MTDLPTDDETIELVCKRCRRSQRVERDEHDWPEAVRVEASCPECNPGDFDAPEYFDASGNHINRDPAELSETHA